MSWVSNIQIKDVKRKDGNILSQMVGILGVGSG